MDRDDATEPATDDQPDDVDHSEESGPDAGALLAGAGIAMAAATLAAPTTAAAAPAPTVAAPTSAAPIAQKKQKAGPGTEKMARLCDGLTGGMCRTPPWSEEHLTFDAVLIGRYVRETWPQVKEVGGWRPSDPYPDHPSGKAVDIMMPNGGSGKDKKLGDEIAAYFQKHADEFGVDYILWRQQQWSADSGKNRWTGMSDRGSPTANHMDHVHITVRGNQATAAKALIAEFAAAEVSTDATGGPQKATDALIPTQTPDEMTNSVVVTLFDSNRRN